MIITKEPFQTLEVKKYNNGCVGIVEKNKVRGEWVAKDTMMYRPQALGVALEILRIYGYAGRYNGQR